MAQRTLQVVISGNASGAEGAFRDTEAAADSFGSKMEGIGAKLMGFGAKMTVGVTLPLALLGKAAFDASKDLAESMNKVDAVFGPNAGGIHRWASGAAEDFGMSKRAAEDAAGTFGNMFLQLGMGLEPATKMSKKMAELAADFASFHNADITEVIQAQSAAFRGEYDALQRFVPTITAAAVETKALAMTGKDNADSLTAQEKAAATYALMMEGAGKALGDFDRTAGSAANKQRELTAKFEDARAKLGDALVPIMLQLAQVLSRVADAFSNLSPGMQQFVVYAGLALAAVGPLATALGAVVTVVGVFSAGVAAVALAIGALVAAAVLLYLKWDEVWSAVANNPWLLAILAPLGAILIPIIALVAAIKLVQENWTTIWPALQSVVETVWAVLQPILDAMAGVVRAIADAAVWLWERWQEAWPVIQSVLQVAWAIMQVILDAMEAVVRGIAGAVEWLKERSEEAWPIIQAAVMVAWAIMQPILESLKAVIDGIVGAVSWIKDNAGDVWSAFSSGVSTMWGVVQGPLNTLLGLLERLLGAARALKNALDGLPGVPGGGIGNVADIVGAPPGNTQLPGNANLPWGGGHAKGGWATGWGMAGEEGPELINFGSGARVYNNADTMKMLSGDVTVVIVRSLDEALGYVPDEARGRTQSAFLAARV